MFLTRHKRLWNNRKRCRFGATRISIWSSESLISLIKSSLLQNVALSCFEGIGISDKKIMRSLQSHLCINADACIRVAICHSYCFSWADKSVSLRGGGVWCGMRNALLRIGLMESTIPCGVSLIMHILTRPTLQEDKQKQLKASCLPIGHTCTRTH